MIPDNISEQNVLQAIQEIDLNGIPNPLSNSRTYDLIFNSRTYPPKYVISIANQFANGAFLDPKKFQPVEAIKYLENLSPNFEIQKKKNDPGIELIERYKKHLKETYNNSEIYKWKLLAQFKGRPNVSNPDFIQELKSIDFSNLVYPAAIGVINQLSLHKTEPYRECFKALFNEDKLLTERMKLFNEETLKLYRELVPDEKLSHHHDERTMATFLTYYNPDKYTFYKDSYYQQCCRLIDIKPREKGEKYAHYMELIDEFIKEYINNDDELKSLISNILDRDCFPDLFHKILAQDILYQTMEHRIGLGRDYWRIGTTDGSTSYWDQMKSNSIVSIGWKELGNLNNAEITSLTDIKSIFKEKGYYQGDNINLSKKSGEVFNFLTGIKIGDIVLAQAGASVLGIGIVKDEYFFDNNLEFPHQKQIDWKILQPRITNNQGLRTTVFKLTDIALLKQIDDLLDNCKISDQKPIIKTKMKPQLNQILFGPPGTGKTFHTVNKALELIGENIEGLDRKKVKALFETKVQEGQIVFTTFHQSMAYEDFIEGIKPLKPEGSNNSVMYDIVPGIFRNLCRKAITPQNRTFDNAYASLLEDIDENGEIELKTDKETFTINTNKDSDDLKIKSASKIENITKYGLSYCSKIPRFSGSWGQYYKAIFQHLKDKYGYKESENTTIKNHVLIIDEINRGNVSQIFGELITLIEEDKRLGQDEALEVILPYSKEKFGVPANLYIIGTMNTADRSVEAIDTALRRRFSFEEVPPRYDLSELLYDYEGFKGFEILHTLNKRIEKLLDKDHQIGHSYFMKKGEENVGEKLLTSFYKNIIPLLQEYFFGDFGKIGLVLGNGFVRKKVWNTYSDSFAEFNYESAGEFDERPVYEIVDYRINDLEHIGFANAIKTLMNKKLG